MNYFDRQLWLLTFCADFFLEIIQKAVRQCWELHVHVILTNFISNFKKSWWQHHVNAQVWTWIRVNIWLATRKMQNGLHTFFALANFKIRNSRTLCVTVRNWNITNLTIYVKQTSQLTILAKAQFSHVIYPDVALIHPSPPPATSP